MRQLDPSKVPADCEQCGKVEIGEGNLDVWEMLMQFPGILKSEISGITVNYSAAIFILEKARIENPLEYLQKFEALARGYR